MPLKLSIIILAVAALLYSCTSPVNKEKTSAPGLTADTSIHYARRFSIASNGTVTAVYLFGNRMNLLDTTAAFFLYKDTAHIKRPSAKNAYVLQVPCKKIAALSSIYVNMFCDLGSLENIAAIDNIDYIINPVILARQSKQRMPELARSPQIDLEQTVKLNPDIVFAFGMGNPQNDNDPKLLQTGIPIAMSVDHLEKSPLARAEWIKFFAAFVDKKDKADSIFSEVERHYFALQEVAKQAGTQPTVFSELKYSDAWYLPGGKSFMAQLIHDAGGDYLWKNDTNAGSLPLSFEQVYAKAKDADYWINLSLVNTKAELLGFESRYTEFNAFKKGNLYNNNKVVNTFGYSTYWETGMIYPDRILNDLICIFHPQLPAPGLHRDLYYYKQIK